jgi:hypothetical protein
MTAIEIVRASVRRGVSDVVIVVANKDRRLTSDKLSAVLEEFRSISLGKLVHAQPRGQYRMEGYGKIRICLLDGTFFDLVYFSNGVIAGDHSDDGLLLKSLDMSKFSLYDASANP